MMSYKLIDDKIRGVGMTTNVPKIITKYFYHKFS